MSNLQVRMLLDWVKRKISARHDPSHRAHKLLLQVYQSVFTLVGLEFHTRVRAFIFQTFEDPILRFAGSREALCLNCYLYDIVAWWRFVRHVEREVGLTHHALRTHCSPMEDKDSVFGYQ